MAEVNNIQKSLDKIIHAIMDLKESFAGEDSLEINDSPTEDNSDIDVDSFEKLSVVLKNDKWPQAVNSALICDPHSENDKEERGRGIIELMIEEDLKNLKFLDYGCGEGHCAFASSNYETKLSVGYDIKEHENWRNFEQRDNLIITNNWHEISQKGPYDVVIIFDVIDHIEGEEPTDLLKKVYDVIPEGGKVYLRCHPWTSRHATHLYHDLNKAYIHLIFSEEELKKLVPKSQFAEHNIGVTRPVNTYKKYIEGSGLKEIHRRDITEKIEPFFKIPKIAERIMKATGHKEFPNFQLSIQFLDWILEKPKKDD